jgi:hypothetical protein
MMYKTFNRNIPYEVEWAGGLAREKSPTLLGT